MPSPQVFDFIVLIIIGWLTMRGAMRGMVAQLASVASVVISWFIAVKFSPIVAPMVSDDPPWNKVVAMLVLFIASSIAIWLIHGLVADIINAIKLKKADRSLGALFGFVKGILLCCILTFFLVVCSDNTRNFALGSTTGKYFAYGIEQVAAMLPDDVSGVLAKNLESFRESIDLQYGPDGIPVKNIIEEGESVLSRWRQDLGDDYSDETQFKSGKSLTESVRNAIDQVKNTFSSVISLQDVQSNQESVPSLLREKVGFPSAIVPSPTEPVEKYTEQTSSKGSKTVLPFQPGK